ncbi:MAG: phosphoglucosamine mutase [Thermodesulfobacteriaceae bacterium]|nr:phosphoglucosamine mutase [Thermodesulfobacteriaceae bacterium]
MKKLFGTDGIRGEANFYPMTPEIALEVGRAVGYLFKNKNHHHGKVLIGKDTRLSGYLFENALTAGLCSAGVNVFLIGPIPTPGIAFLTMDMRADAGIMISASHNPYFDNGIKIFDHKGYKLTEEEEEKIENLIFSENFKNYRAQKEEIGRVFRIKDALGRYAVHLKSVVPSEINFEGVKVGLDCANGACYFIGPLVFEELGAQVCAYACEPNGLNINENCGALYPDKAQKLLAEKGLDIAFAVDGDGDRIVVIDDRGNLWDGDDLLAFFTLYFKEKGLLIKPIVIGTLMTNQGLERFLEKHQIRLFRTQVGDKYVLSAMKEQDAILGGETSGHIIFLDKSTTGDGLLCALRLLSVLIEKNKPLSYFYPPFDKYPQVLINVKVKEKKDPAEINGLESKLKEIKEKLIDEGRVVVRPSGTEPKYRIMVEAKYQDLAEELAKNLADFLVENLK